MTREPERRVLVVDDEAAIRLALVELLETEGYVVDAARNGAEALAAMREYRPALAIVDLMMPGVDGWSLLGSCRADPTLADVPVIVMSARPDAQQAAAAAGARLCLTKPFDVDVLLSAIDEIFHTGPDCAVCGSSGATHQLPIFAEIQPATWDLCGRCWHLLEAGFASSHRGQRLVAYLERPGFRITNPEVTTYVRLGLSSLSGHPGGAA